MKAEQTTETKSCLIRAQQAATQGNWSEVIHYLQQLSIFSDRASFAATDRANKQLILKLVLTVLINGDFQQKWNVSKICSYIGDYGVSSWIALLDDANINSETKWFTARLLGNYPIPEVILALARLLQNTTESDLIAMTAESLVKIGTPAIETLVYLLDKTEYRLIAAKSLAHIRLSPVLPHLQELVKDTNPEIRLLAIEALSSFHEAQIPQILIAALQDNSSSVRKEAAIGLGFRSDLCQQLDLVTHLKPLLYDLNLNVCRQTAIALGKMNNLSAIEALSECLQSPNTPLGFKIDIIKALAWSEIPLALDCLATTLTTDNNVLSQKIITVLGRISIPELQLKAIAILRYFWDSTPLEQIDLELKKVLATALGELKATTQQDILEQLANDENKMVSLYAIASLKKISS